ncbi:MAG: DUF255 domain-containing protein [Rhodospirillales bacterium]
MTAAMAKKPPWRSARQGTLVLTLFRAKADSKPILLSIGYAAGRWGHVMALAPAFAIGAGFAGVITGNSQ